ncbi:dihydroorotase [Rhodocytophaga aerolata]|uniref:Dihydroorotase n=1 Tax=Rhodocytophaga aerolata TaxID=455078 RepID=A0ABT8QYK2_9BACT|nr:dihydroorotase [Rhodocytophaga aerolata]MDO1444921.1 dihydroorotase [Rhodocytophaga aerolata]
MKILIRSAEIIAPNSQLNGQRRDIWIENGIIKNIANAGELPTTEAHRVYKDEALKVSAGWVDMRALAKDPGLEHQEDLYTVRDAAAAGGFTEIALLPNTHPFTQTKESIIYAKTKGNTHAVTVHPMAGVTIDGKGKDLTEMIDLHMAGAIAFTDGIKPVWHSDILVKTLQYLQTFNGLLINRPEDTLLTQFGNMHEGITSTMLGLKGIPAIAEEMMIARDLRFLEYAGGKIHFSTISTAKAVQLIRQAKHKGLKVSCDIAAHQIAFDDTALLEFDTNLKVNPPFRSQADIAALWEGLADNTIDAIVSDHNPLDIESKKLEFDLAEFGITGLETAFALINTYNKILSVSDMVEKLAIRPRQILQLPVPAIEEGQVANLTLFSTELEWTYLEKNIRSKSLNSPFIGQTFKGKPLAIINNGKIA